MADHFTFTWELSAEEAPLTTSNDILFGVPSAHNVQLEGRGRSYTLCPPVRPSPGIMRLSEGDMIPIIYGARSRVVASSPLSSSVSLLYQLN